MDSNSFTPMEKPQFETLIPPPESTFFFHHRRRKSHLKSETYRTLAQILTRCYDYSPCSLFTPIDDSDTRLDSVIHELGRSSPEGVRQELTELDNEVRNELEKSTGEEVRKELEKSSGEEGCNELPGRDGGRREEMFFDESVDGTTRVIDTEGGMECNDMVVDESSKLNDTEGDMECDVIVVDECIEANNAEGVMELNDTGVDQNFKVIDARAVDSNPVQMKMNEFECILSGEGNEELITDNCNNPSTLSVDNNPNCKESEEFIESREKCLALQNFLMEESGGLEQLLLDTEEHHKFLEDVGSPFDNDSLSEFFEAKSNVEEKMSHLKTDETELCELEQKDTELEKSICISNEIVSTILMGADEDMEEGEISDDLGLCDQLDLYEDIVTLEEKVDSEQTSGDVIKEMVTATEQKSHVVHDTFSNAHNLERVDDMDTCPADELHKKIDIECNDKMFAPEISVDDKKEDVYLWMPEAQRNKNLGSESEETLNHLKICRGDRVLYRDAFLENTSNGEFASTKEDVDVRNKKKRGGASQAKKEKGKRRKRIKRAELNRQLGVKRLKLLPVMKPKTIKTCDHYLKGRCRKGDQCTFSHDVVPLTKSKACTHFARKSCMKGDDCPFDHELSKYPCDNLVKKGFCIRGDACMFSHKMPVNGSPTTPNACKPESTPPLPLGNSDLKKQQNSCSLNNLEIFGINAGKNASQDASEIALKLPTQPPKGMKFVSFGKSTPEEPKQGGSSPKGNNIKLGNQMNPSALTIVQSLNEVQKRIPPAMAPKGINFFSFGASPSNDSISKIQDTLPSESGIGTFRPSLNNSREMNLVSSPLKPGFGMHESRNMHEMPQKDLPAFATPGINPFSLGKCQSDSFNIKQQTSFPIKKDNNIKLSTIQNSSPAPSLLSLSSFSSAQSLGKLSDGHKNIPNSAQKALLSTLAFAARIEPTMKMRIE